MALLVTSVMLVGFIGLMAWLEKRDEEAELRRRDVELYARWLDKRNESHNAN